MLFYQFFLKRYYSAKSLPFMMLVFLLKQKKLFKYIQCNSTKFQEIHLTRQPLYMKQTLVLSQS